MPVQPESTTPVKSRVESCVSLEGAAHSIENASDAKDPSPPAQYEPPSSAPPAYSSQNDDVPVLPSEALDSNTDSESEGKGKRKRKSRASAADPKYGFIEGFYKGNDVQSKHR